jgi:hypothetical protein
MTVFKEMTLGKRIAFGIALMLGLMLVVGGGRVLRPESCGCRDEALHAGEFTSNTGSRFQR